MSFTPCPLCWAPLESAEGSPCTNARCLNGRKVRDREAGFVPVAPLTGQVAPLVDDDDVRAARKRRRKAARVARRHNRRR